MARGRITEYRQGSFSPQAVGTPGMDRSGQILGQGIEAFGEALAKREEATDSVAAVNQYGNFQLQYAQKKIDLQKQYQNDPMKFVQAAKELGDKLADEYGKGLSGGAAAKFKRLALGHSAQDIESNANWAFRRDSEIQVGKIQSAYQNQEFSASLVSSPDDLRKLKQGYSDLSREGQFDRLITSESNKKLQDESWGRAKNQALNAMLANQPNQLKAALDSGAYKGVLDPDEIESFSTKARIAIEGRRWDDIYATLYAGEDKTLAWMKNLDNRTADISDLVRERDSINMKIRQGNDQQVNAVLQAYSNNLDALVSMQTRSIQRTELGKEQAKTVLGDFKRSWDAYLSKKSTDRKQPSIDDLTEQLRLSEKLWKAYGQGLINRNDLFDHLSILSTKNEISKNALGGAMPFNEAIQQVGAATGFWPFRNGRDAVSVGYRKIRENIDAQYPELSEEERLGLKTQMMVQYNQQLSALSPEQLKAMKTDPQIDRVARQLILGGVNAAGEMVPGIAQSMVFFRDRFRQIDYKIGDSKQDSLGNVRIFKGKKPDGAPIWSFRPGDTITGPGGKKAKVREDGSLEQING